MTVGDSVRVELGCSDDMTVGTSVAVPTGSSVLIPVLVGARDTAPRGLSVTGWLIVGPDVVVGVGAEELTNIGGLGKTGENGLGVDGLAGNGVKGARVAIVDGVGASVLVLTEVAKGANVSDVGVDTGAVVLTGVGVATGTGVDIGADVVTGGGVRSGVCVTTGIDGFGGMVLKPPLPSRSM
jgi:hypothetical protein